MIPTTRIQIGVMLAMTGLWACTPATSATPFSNSVPEGVDVYLYGSAAESRSSKASDDRGDSAQTEKPRPKRKKISSKSARTSTGKETSAKGSDGGAKAAISENTARGDKARPRVVIAGTYKGTDWVTITLPGFPDSEQEDDKARVVIKALDTNDSPIEGEAREEQGSNGEASKRQTRYSFSVLDTNSGKELCTLLGTFEDKVLKFDDDQSCFSGILGVPMEATVEQGEAHVDGKTLSTEFTVSLIVPTPNGELEGELDYSFEGKSE